MVKLSVVIITFNEEKNIRRCLESIRDIADEIIVVDSLSTDSTESICAEYGVRFIKQTWLGYSGQKNFANEKASYDWIFSIDADEALSDILKDSIAKWKNKDFAEDNVFSMNRLTNYCGKWIHHCGWYPDTKIRIWNRKIGKWEGDIHETIRFTENITSSNLKGDLLHYSYHTIHDHVKQFDKFTDLTANEAFMKGKRVSLFGIRLKTFWKFFHDYFFELGFLDGYYGYVVCKLSSFATLLKYTKLHELNKTKK